MLAFYSVNIGITIRKFSLTSRPGGEQQICKQEHKGMLAKLTVVALEFVVTALDSILKPTAVKQSCHIIHKRHILV